jgi:hypothetical protein
MSIKKLSEEEKRKKSSKEEINIIKKRIIKNYSLKNTVIKKNQIR